MDQSQIMEQACFQLQESMRTLHAVLDGEVAHLVGNGWTDAQARAIVAYTFGWRPADGSKPEGAA